MGSADGPYSVGHGLEHIDSVLAKIRDSLSQNILLQKGTSENYHVYLTVLEKRKGNSKFKLPSQGKLSGRPN